MPVVCAEDAEVLHFKVIETPLRHAKVRAGELGQAAQVLQLIPRGLATYAAAWNKGAEELGRLNPQLPTLKSSATGAVTSSSNPNVQCPRKALEQWGSRWVGLADSPRGLYSLGPSTLFLKLPANLPRVLDLIILLPLCKRKENNLPSQWGAITLRG
jgi:hypothetical protein